MTILEAVALVIAEVRAEQSPTSWHTYTWHGRCMIEQFGPDTDLAAITRQDVQAWINAQRSQVAPATIRHRLSGPVALP